MAAADIASLREGDRSKVIEVRLIRKWRPRIKSQDTYYIFLDKEVHRYNKFIILLIILYIYVFVFIIYSGYSNTVLISW